MDGVELPTDIVDSIVNARSRFYRLPERETMRTPAKLPKETHITFARAIERAGYRFRSDDLDSQTVLQPLCVRVVAHTTGLTTEQVESILAALDLYSPFRRVKYNLIPYLLAQLKKASGAGDCNLRTLWYRNSQEEPRPEPAIIEGKVAKWIGAWNPGYASGGYEDGWDYDPPYLSAISGRIGALYQELYRVRTWYSCDILVHPLDVVQSA